MGPDLLISPTEVHSNTGTTMVLTDEEIKQYWDEECETSSILGVPHLKMRKNINHWTHADIIKYFETNGEVVPPEPEVEKMKVAMLFAGQGTQRVGMAQDIQNTELFDQASAILGYDLLKLCNEGPDEQLQQTAYSQP